LPDVASADLGELERFLDVHPDTEYIDAIFVDICGIVRGNRYPRADLSKLFSSGLQIPITVYLLDITGDSDDPGGKGFTDGDPDGTAVPIAGSLVAVPWSTNAGQVLMTVQNADGSPNQFDPRNVAARVVERMAADGYHPVVAFELEFYLFDREFGPDGAPQTATSPRTGERETTTQDYGIDELDAFGDFFRDIRDACDAQGIPASVATKAFAPGQYEINLRHVADPLAAADHGSLLRHVVKNVAASHGMRASFISKPFAEQVGSGMHLHMSVLDSDGANIFAADHELGSPQLGHAIAGLRAVMAESMAIYAPHVNAFQRFGLNMFTPLNTS
jgi:glutamine synthetase